MLCKLISGRRAPPYSLAGVTASEGFSFYPFQSYYAAAAAVSIFGPCILSAIAS